MPEKNVNEWEIVMRETRGAWSEHPVFKEMDDAVEIVNWLRGTKVKNGIKTLERLDKRELIQLITELAKLKKDNMEWLEIDFQRPDGLPEMLEYYKKKISRALDSNDLTAGKKAISDFKKASPDRESLIDLMIYYVEQGTEITLDCGDMYEDFYTRLENVYIETIKLRTNGAIKNLSKNSDRDWRSLLIKLRM